MSYALKVNEQTKKIVKEFWKLFKNEVYDNVDIVGIGEYAFITVYNEYSKLVEVYDTNANRVLCYKDEFEDEFEAYMYLTSSSINKDECEFIMLSNQW